MMNKGAESRPGYVTISYIVAFAVLIIVIFLGIYLDNYFGAYKIKYSSSWQYGYKQAVEFINQNQDKYERIFITKRYGEPHIFYAFYNASDPILLWPGSENNIRFKQSDWFWTDKIDKVLFVNDWEIPNQETVFRLSLESGFQVSTYNSLLITSPDHLPGNAKIIKQIKFLDGSDAFTVAEFK